MSNKNLYSGIVALARRSAITMALCAFAASCVVWALEAPATAGPHAIGSNSSASAGSGSSDSRRPVRVAQGQKPEPLTVKGKVLRGKLNLNTATEEQLQILPGIGVSKARRIVEHRQKRGKFKRVRDLRRVKGIGYKTLNKLSPYLAVKGQTTLSLK